MAKLHTNIVITAELRPCITTAHGNRCKGLFHKWATERLGDMSVVVGIIELETGVILKESPEYIRFIDNKAKQYFAENVVDDETERID